MCAQGSEKPPDPLQIFSCFQQVSLKEAQDGGCGILPLIQIIHLYLLGREPESSSGAPPPFSLLFPEHSVPVNRASRGWKLHRDSLLLCWDTSACSHGSFKGTQLSDHSWKQLKCGRAYPASTRRVCLAESHEQSFKT